MLIPRLQSLARRIQRRLSRWVISLSSSSRSVFAEKSEADRKSTLKKFFDWEGLSFVTFLTIGLALIAVSHQYGKTRWCFLAAGIALTIKIVTEIEAKFYVRCLVTVLASIVAGISVNRVNDWVTSLEITERSKGVSLARTISVKSNEGKFKGNSGDRTILIRDSAPNCRVDDLNKCSAPDLQRNVLVLACLIDSLNQELLNRIRRAHMEVLVARNEDEKKMSQMDLDILRKKPQEEMTRFRESYLSDAQKYGDELRKQRLSGGERTNAAWDCFITSVPSCNLGTLAKDLRQLAAMLPVPKKAARTQTEELCGFVDQLGVLADQGIQAIEICQNQNRAQNSAFQRQTKEWIERVRTLLLPRAKEFQISWPPDLPPKYQMEPGFWCGEARSKTTTLTATIDRVLYRLWGWP